MWTIAHVLPSIPPMFSGNPHLIELIRAEIAAGAAMRFPRFMELALYHPQHGYYASGKARIGRKGDFYTNVSVGPLFGRLMAVQFEEMWERLGQPAQFTVVEQGAHDGQFAVDLLSAAEGEFSRAMRYHIVEPFPILQRAQRERLAPFAGRVQWSADLETLPEFAGVHFSNELLDAMPVHLIRFEQGEWRELRVGNGALVAGELSEPLASAVARLDLAPIEGYTTEVALSYRDWTAKMAQRLSAGYVLAVDYGFPRKEFYTHNRTAGTLSCYRKHRRSSDPLEGIGESDLTAHVEFTAVAEAALGNGLALAGFCDQHHFIVGLIPLSFPDEAQAPQQELRALHTLSHPGLMGQAFKFIGFSKGVDGNCPISGFSHAGDAAASLGLLS